MKKRILFLLCCFLSTLLYAQVDSSSAREKSFLSDNDWDKITQNLSNENWDSANKEATFFLKKYTGSNINHTDAELLRTMFIVSEAGLMNEDKITQEVALKAVKKFAGLKIILPGHPLSAKGGFNVIQPHNSNTDTLFITESNKLEDRIFCFEYVTLEKKMSMEEFNKNIDSEGVIEGTITSIKVEGHAFPRYKIYINEATLHIRLSH